ncbi:MAG: hypothetical protein V4613_03025 [Bacteroidota bacterium]
MSKIYYITQYFDIKSDKALGGILIRKKQIELFKKNGLDLIIVMPDFSGSKVRVEDNIIYVPFFYQKQICDILERTGLWPDQFYDFSLKALKYLQSSVTKDDIIFCVTGGTLETIILGSKLKTITGCKFYINFQDPINHTSVHGRYVDNSIRVKRDHLENKYIKNVDIIFTSSDTFRENLINKYHFLSADNVINSYFGYVKEVPLVEKDSKDSKNITLMYSGVYGQHQQPEKFCKIFSALENRYTLYFLGNHSQYEPIQKYLNDYEFVDFMPHDTFLKWVQHNIDIGFVSLTSDYLSACVPSKIYEYINLNLPIIGFLPESDAKELVNKNGFGRIFNYNDETGFADFVKNELDNQFIEKCRVNIIAQREQWSMEHTFHDILKFFENNNR